MRHAAAHGRRVLLALGSVLLSTQVLAQPAPRRLPADQLDGPPLAEVLVVGSYHMDNPGRDIFNMKADDVLAPRRQAEIREVIEALTRFRPTKIAIEAEPDSRKMTEYGAYLAGRYELTRDERDQLGFRLAKELGQPKVYGIDLMAEFPYAAVQDFAKAHGRDAELASLQEKVGASVKRTNEYLASHTVLETLLRMNAPESVRRDLASYAMFAHFGDGDEYDYPGAELLSQWYRRNIRIMTNLVQIIAPGDRVLVIYGAGHLGLLRQAVEADPTLHLRTLAEFVRRHD